MFQGITIVFVLKIAKRILRFQHDMNKHIVTLEQKNFEKKIEKEI
jgi:hypothetical protein